MSHKLPTINAEELLSCPMPPTRFIIDQLLPQGLHILAGATKIGKSWLALALCLCVVKGEALWSFAAQKCGVLYLCLEDSYQRYPLQTPGSHGGCTGYAILFCHVGTAPQWVGTADRAVLI